MRGGFEQGARVLIRGVSMIAEFGNLVLRPGLGF